ncbi:MAG: ribosomal protein S18-alanine N-acetyltransferase [Proteobacteria bacterium]|nr:ribosomal protein S18-alanine N-acetyltransferase [Pseudomonadota bacterium]
MIRRAVASDAEAIAAVEGAGAFHPWTAASVQAQLALRTVRALVVEVEGHIHGHLISSVVVDEAEVLTVVVHPDARRRGFGRELLATATLTWRAEGVLRAFLEVRAGNAAARRLYEEAGWTESGRRADYYGVGEHAVIYSVRL